MVKQGTLLLVCSLLISGWVSSSYAQGLLAQQTYFDIAPFNNPHGLYYKEIMKNGKVRHVVEKNIVVLLQDTLSILPNSDSKEQNKIKRENRKIEAANQFRLGKLKELEQYFNGDPERGAKNSDGEPVYFKFNIIKENVNSPQNVQMANEFSKKYGIVFSDPNGLGKNVTILAAVFTSINPKGELGKSQGNIIYNIGWKSPVGTLPHEIGHTLCLHHNHGVVGDHAFGSGLMGYPPMPICAPEIDQILQQCFRRGL